MRRLRDKKEREEKTRKVTLAAKLQYKNKTIKMQEKQIAAYAEKNRKLEEDLNEIKQFKEAAIPMIKVM